MFPSAKIEFCTSEPGVAISSRPEQVRAVPAVRLRESLPELRGLVPAYLYLAPDRGSNQLETALRPLSDLRDELFLVGETAGLEFRVHQMAVHRNFKATSAGWLQLQALDSLFELAQDLGRQTDGLRLVVSSRAVTKLNSHACDSQWVRREPDAATVICLFLSRIVSSRPFSAQQPSLSEPLFGLGRRFLTESLSPVLRELLRRTDTRDGHSRPPRHGWWRCYKPARRVCSGHYVERISTPETREGQAV